MEWLGQYIQELTTRFRSDVYLEDISTGTIASGAHLGLDSNNKIVKAVDGGGDLTSIVAGTGLSGTSLTGPIPTLNVDASLTHVGELGTIETGTWQGTAIASAYLDGDTAHLSGAQIFDGVKEFSAIKSAIFDGDKSVSPGDGAVIHVDAHDVTDSNTSAFGTTAMYTHVNIEAPRLLATNSSVTTTAAATLYINNAPSASTNQTLTNQYALWVDAGLVKFDGALTVDGTITGTLGTATQPNITSIGTDGDTLSILGDYTRFTNTTTAKPNVQIWNYTDDAQSSLIEFIKARLDGSIQAGEAGDRIGRLEFSSYNAAGTPEYVPYARIDSSIHDPTDGEESGRLTLQVANHDGGMGSGLILTGGSVNDEIDVTLGLGVASATSVAGTMTISGEKLLLTNATANKPEIQIQSTSDDANGGTFTFQKARVDSTVQVGEDNDVIGNIDFWAYDDQASPPALNKYAAIYADIHDATAGQESGRLTFQVGNHDAGLGSGLILTGGSADNEIDVTLGLGAASVVTIPGHIDLAGDIDVDGTLETDALTIGGTTVAAAGTTSITTLGTITTGVWNGTKITDVYTNSSGRRYGSTIKVLPSDFMINDDAASPLSFKDGANSGVHVNDVANEAIAFVTIPEGMKATHVDVFGTHNRTLTVDELDVNASYDFTGTARGVGSCNTQLDITDVNATATNYLALTVSLSATTNRVWGGIVTIAPQ